MYVIKEYRKSKGLKQEFMAEIIQTSKVNYCKKENGQVKFSLDEAYAISKRFGEPIESIFGQP